MRQESNRREFQRLRLTLIQTSTSLKKTEFLRKNPEKSQGAVAKFTGFQRVLPVPLLLENLTGNLF
jgi:hypothetical protein